MSGLITTGKIVLTNTTGNQDSFDRLRVSEPLSLFETQSTIDENLHAFSELTSGTGSITMKPDDSYIEMALTSGGVGKVIRQSKNYIAYQSGKSKMNMFTGVLEESGGVATSISRIGIYDSTTDKTTVAGNGNGLFFELNGTTLSVVKRLKDVDTGVPQASWNYDTFDGTGPSGLTITDWSKAYLFVIDLQYLGVGRARFGFYYNGVIRYCHYFNHSGGADAITAPYIKTAKLPIRYEIVSSAGVNAKMRMMCATVHSEGGYLPQGRTFAIGRQTAASISGANYIPLIAIRLVKTEPNNRATGIVQQINVMNHKE